MNFKKNNDKILVFGLLAMVLLAFFFKGGFKDYDKKSGLEEKEPINSLYADANAAGEGETETLSSSENLENNKIVVHVAGEVQSPGIYEFQEGDRVFDAIEKAGGLTDKAYEDGINLALKLSDEMKLNIYSEKEYMALSEAGSSNSGMEINGLQESGGASNKVSLNRASKEELMTLPGIGPKTADKIIDYREKNGFKSIEEIKNVNGIGEKTFEKLKDLIEK